MLIEAPCLLGEQFEHNKRWGSRGPLYLVGLDLFAWSCGLDGVTLLGSRSRYAAYHTDFFDRDDVLETPISFEVPDRCICNGAGVPLRELGLESDKIGWLRSLRMYKDGTWRYGVICGRDKESREVRTEALDRLFSPVLPAVRMTVTDFM